MSPVELAVHVRGLASDVARGVVVVNGAGRPFYGDGEPCCALGYLCVRAGFPEKSRDAFTSASEALESILGVSLHADRQYASVVAHVMTIILANDNAGGARNRRDRLLSPLNALAYALDAVQAYPAAS